MILTMILTSVLQFGHWYTDIQIFGEGAYYCLPPEIGKQYKDFSTRRIISVEVDIQCDECNNYETRCPMSITCSQCICSEGL